MELDYDQFKDAATEGSNAPKTASGGLSGLESALDEIQRAKEMERRLQDELGPSVSDQVLKLAQDPKIQRAAREVWYGPEEAASASSSSAPNGGPERAEVTPEVTPEVTDSPESAVTECDLDPIQRDLGAVTDYEAVTRIDIGRDVVELGIATDHNGDQRVTVTDGDEIIQYRAEEFMEWAEREGYCDRSETDESRRQRVREWYDELFETKKGKVLFALALHEYHRESSLFDNQKDLAECFDTSHNYVRKVKSKHSGRVTIDFGDEFDSIEVDL